RVTEVLSVIFLIATTEQRNELAVEINFFQRREEIIPVALRFAVVPGWDTEQQNIKGFKVFFAAFSDIMNFSHLFTELLLDHFCNVFCIARIAAKENAYDCHDLLTS